MKRLPRWLALAFAFLPSWQALAAPIIREPGAIYLSDFDQKPLKLRVLGPNVPCYFDIAMSRFAGTLRFPQIVQVEAVSDAGCRIRGNAQQGGVAAWVAFNQLEALPDGLLANFKKSEERRKLVDALIAKNEVAIGMTQDEVGRSLGKPQKTSKRADRNGIQQVWEYIKYELVPQTTYAPGYNQSVVTYPGGGGRPGGTVIQSGAGYSAATIYVKVPVGKLSVNFKDGIVEALDQSEGTLAGAGTSIVVPPLEVTW